MMRKEIRHNTPTPFKKLDREFRDKAFGQDPVKPDTITRRYNKLPERDGTDTPRNDGTGISDE
jgi:hypothetical protein